MKRIHLLLAAVLIASAFATFGVGSAACAQDAPSGDAENGKRVYLADGCFTCHGRAGQGGNYYGATPILAKTKLPLGAFKAELRDPVRVMPAYSEAVLSDAEIADMYAFLQGLSGPRPVKDIPILGD
jgi:mono/diheme cytochrome c family protein